MQYVYFVGVPGTVVPGTVITQVCDNRLISPLRVAR